MLALGSAPSIAWPHAPAMCQNSPCIAFAQPDHAAAKTQWRLVADPMRPKLPTLMDTAEEEVLAYMTFPAQHRAELHSTDEIDKPNPIFPLSLKCAGDLVAKRDASAASVAGPPKDASPS